MPSPVKDIKGNNLIRDETMDVSEIQRAWCQYRINEPRHEISNKLTLVDSDEPLQPPFKLRNSKWCSVSSLTIIEYTCD